MTTVLLVDDEPDALSAFGLLLQMSGYHVEPAANGDEALQRMAMVRPDIVVTDWMMPGRGGKELCAELRRSNGPYGNIPVIVTSGAMDALLDRSLYDRFLRKPLLFDELLQAIRELLAQQSASDMPGSA